MISNLISVNINSSPFNVNSGTTDNFNYTINLPADLFNRLNAVSITSITLPKSFYQINELNNTFTIIEDITSIPITITPGNYNTSQWFSTLSSLMTAASTHGVIYSVSF